MAGAEKPRPIDGTAAPFTFLQLATMTAGLAREPDEAGPFWTGPVSTLIEWDDDIPPFEELVAEAEKARVIREEVFGASAR